MYFTFQKSKDNFIFTDICPELLDSMLQERDDWVGKTVDTASHIGDKMTREKLKQFYALAWNQKKVLFYYFPYKNPDIFIVTYLEPQTNYNQVTKIIGHCMPVYKKDLQFPLQHVDQFLSL